MTWPWQWATASNKRAVENARQASTALSRGRVEREEVEMFLQQRYAEPWLVSLDPEVVQAAQ
jgi:hypothetical protein